MKLKEEKRHLGFKTKNLTFFAPLRCNFKSFTNLYLNHALSCLFRFDQRPIAFDLALKTSER
jgi:hypothetical protein